MRDFKEHDPTARQRTAVPAGRGDPVRRGRFPGAETDGGHDEPRRTSRGEPRRQDTDLRCILDNMFDGVIVSDRRGRLRHFNRAAERLVGAGRLDPEVARWPETHGLFRPDQRTLYGSGELPMTRALRGEEVRDVEMYVRRAADGPGTWLHVSASPLLCDDGTIQGAIAICRDVTKEKSSRALLDRLSAVVEQTADAVFVTDSRGTIIYVNPAFENTTGFTREEAVGRTPGFLRSGAHPPEFYEELRETVRAGEVYRNPIINRTKDGDLIHCEEIITPMKDSLGRVTHHVAVLRDMTDRQRVLAQEMELKLASVVQARLYPGADPRWPELDVAGAVTPAAEMCGDYFDYFRFPGGEYGLAVGDVSGHGLGPALVMAETRAYLRSLAAGACDLQRLFSRLNAILFEDLDDSRFVTLALLSVDPATGTLCYANAGHLPAYVLTPSGEVKAVLKATGPPLGLLSGKRYEAGAPVRLSPGDITFVVTDGITESTDPGEAFFEMTGVLEVVREMRHRPAREINDAVHRAVREFSGDSTPRDDMTMVVTKFLPGEPSSAIASRRGGGRPRPGPAAPRST